MSQFESAIFLVLKHEGGLVDDPSDPGGITNQGISLRYLDLLVKQHPSMLSELDLNENAKMDTYDVQHMSEEEVIKLYRTDWWDKYAYGSIDDQSLATKLLDLAVNMGPHRAAELLQKACCELAGYQCLSVDGILGGLTYGYINQLPSLQQSRLLSIFCDLAAQYYLSLIKQRPAFEKYLSGWLKRVYDFG